MEDSYFLLTVKDSSGETHHIQIGQEVYIDLDQVTPDGVETVLSVCGGYQEADDMGNGEIRPSHLMTTFEFFKDKPSVHPEIDDVGKMSTIINLYGTLPEDLQ